MEVKIKIFNNSLWSICIICLIVILFSGFVTNDDNVAGDIKFEVIKEGFISGFTNEQQMVIDNNDEYQKMMAVIYANLDQMPIVPELDFDKYTVILAALGTKNTGGYKVNIDKIRKSGRYITANLTESSPGANCILTDMITSPYQVIKVKKINKEVKFKINKIVQNCN